LESEIFHVQYKTVGNHFMKKAILKLTLDFIQEKNHINARLKDVIKFLQLKVIWMIISWKVILIKMVRLEFQMKKLKKQIFLIILNNKRYLKINHQIKLIKLEACYKKELTICRSTYRQQINLRKNFFIRINLDHNEHQHQDLIKNNQD